MLCVQLILTTFSAETSSPKLRGDYSSTSDVEASNEAMNDAILEHNNNTEIQEIRGLGCVTKARTRARVTQLSPHIFLHICSSFPLSSRLSHSNSPHIRHRRHGRHKARDDLHRLWTRNGADGRLSGFRVPRELHRNAPGQVDRGSLGPDRQSIGPAVLHTGR